MSATRSFFRTLAAFALVAAPLAADESAGFTLNLDRLDIGFRSEGLLAAELDPPAALSKAADDGIDRFYERVADAGRRISVRPKAGEAIGVFEEEGLIQRSRGLPEDVFALGEQRCGALTIAARDPRGRFRQGLAGGEALDRSGDRRVNARCALAVALPVRERGREFVGDVLLGDAVFVF